MQNLSAAGCAAAFDMYCGLPHFFPLIASVLTKSQLGRCLGDDPDQPQACYVEHSFGFAQIFGAVSAQFAAELRNCLITERNFPIAKVRLYTPWLLPALEEQTAWQSWRVRFHLNEELFQEKCQNLDPGDCVPVTADNLPAVAKAFGLVTRFWPSEDSFLQNGHAWIKMQDNAPVAICYAAALARQFAEIDVLTLPEWRGHGFGLRVTAAFIRHCLGNSLIPLWDCFANNHGSLSLARRTGFLPVGQPYQFYTIPTATNSPGSAHV